MLRKTMTKEFIRTSTVADYSVAYWLVECDKWNWNYNETEIAKQLINERITTESEEFENFKEAFTQFFTGDQKHNDRTLEVIGHILETFGDG